MNTAQEEETTQKAYVQNPFTQFFLYLLIGWVAFLALMLMLLCMILIVIAVAALPIIADEVCKKAGDTPVVDPEVPSADLPTLSPPGQPAPPPDPTRADMTKPPRWRNLPPGLHPRNLPPGLHPRSRPRPPRPPIRPPRRRPPHRPGPGPRRPRPIPTHKPTRHPKHKHSKKPTVTTTATTTPSTTPIGMGPPRRFPRPKPIVTTLVPKIEIIPPIATPIVVTYPPPPVAPISKLPKPPTQQEKPTWIHLPIFPTDNQTASNKEKRSAQLVPPFNLTNTGITISESGVNTTTTILRAPIIKAVLSEREMGPSTALQLVMDRDYEWLQSKKSATVIQNVVQVNGLNVTIELKLKRETRRERITLDSNDCKNNVEDTFCFN